MFVDLEIIFNNTYSYIQFTYKVPDSLNESIDIGDIVEVTFRNTIRTAVVLNVNSNNSHLKNIKDIQRKIGQIDKYHLKYLQQLAISNNINIGMLLYKYINYKNLSKQNVLPVGKSSINKNSDLIKKLNDSENIIFTSSLKEAKEVAKEMGKNNISVNFYQKTGGLNEFLSYWENIKEFDNIILLSVNFEKIIIKNSFNVHFYNCNNFSYNLPSLNNINIVESSIIKHKIFKGNFYYYCEFPSLELFNKVDKYFLEIPDVEFTYVYGDSLQECREVFDRMFNDQEMNIFTKNKDFEPLSSKHKISYDINKNHYDSVILFNPTISHNGVLSSGRLINFIKTVSFFAKKKNRLIIFSTNKVNFNKQLTETKINRWAEKERSERAKYGPNINLKIFKVTSEKELNISKFTSYLIGPKMLNDVYVYELKIQINKKYNYNEIMSIFSLLKNSQLDRVKSL